MPLKLEDFDFLETHVLKTGLLNLLTSNLPPYHFRKHKSTAMKRNC